MSTSSYYGYDYFSGANIYVNINGVPALEVAGISYQVQDSTAPIYGYSSRIFDAVALGQKIVRGTLIINFIQPNYLAMLIERGRVISGSSAGLAGAYESLTDTGAAEQSVDDAYEKYEGPDSELAKLREEYKATQLEIKELIEKRNNVRKKSNEELARDFDRQLALSDFLESVNQPYYDATLRYNLEKPIMRDLRSSGIEEQARLNINKIISEKEDKLLELEKRALPIIEKQNNLLNSITQEKRRAKRLIDDEQAILLELQQANAIATQNNKKVDAKINALNKIEKDLNDTVTRLNSEDFNSREAAFRRLDAIEGAYNTFYTNSEVQSVGILDSVTTDIGLLGPFTIDINFAKEYTVRVIDAFFTNRGSMVQIDESAIVEEYGFFARDIKYITK